MQNWRCLVERVLQTLAFSPLSPEPTRTMQTVTFRQLRTRFPEVRKLIEREGEVILSDQGRPAFVISEHPARQMRRMARSRKSQKIDYYARLLSYMPEPISAEASRAIHELNRAER